MRDEVRRGALRAVGANLLIWLVAAAAGIVPPAADSIATVVGVAIASAAGVAGAGLVAGRFVGSWTRREWNVAAVVVLLLSMGSPIALAIGAIPVSPFDPENTLLAAYATGIGAIYAILHVTTFAAVQQTVAREFRG